MRLEIPIRMNLINKKQCNFPSYRICVLLNLNGVGVCVVFQYNIGNPNLMGTHGQIFEIPELFRVPLEKVVTPFHGKVSL